MFQIPYVEHAAASYHLCSSRNRHSPPSPCASLSPLPLIDSHVHVWKHDPAFPFAAGANPPAEDATVDMLLELMHANEVSPHRLIQVIHYRWDNSYLASVLKRYPRTFRVFAASIRKIQPRRTTSAA